MSQANESALLLCESNTYPAACQFEHHHKYTVVLVNAYDRTDYVFHASRGHLRDIDRLVTSKVEIALHMLGVPFVCIRHY